jgi:hypothetical protein
LDNRAIDGLGLVTIDVVLDALSVYFESEYIVIEKPLKPVVPYYEANGYTKARMLGRTVSMMTPRQKAVECTQLPFQLIICDHPGIGHDKSIGQIMDLKTGRLAPKVRRTKESADKAAVARVRAMLARPRDER